MSTSCLDAPPGIIPKPAPDADLNTQAPKPPHNHDLPHTSFEGAGRLVPAHFDCAQV